MPPTEGPEAAAAPGAERRDWRSALREDVRHHWLAYLAVAAMCVMGPVFAHMIFPDAPLPLVIFGGVAFGLHFGFCALADKLFE